MLSHQALPAVKRSQLHNPLGLLDRAAANQWQLVNRCSLEERDNLTFQFRHAAAGVQLVTGVFKLAAERVLVVVFVVWADPLVGGPGLSLAFCCLVLGHTGTAGDSGCCLSGRGRWGLLSGRGRCFLAGRGHWMTWFDRCQQSRSAVLFGSFQTLCVRVTVLAWIVSFTDVVDVTDVIFVWLVLAFGFTGFLLFYLCWAKTAIIWKRRESKLALSRTWGWLKIEDCSCFTRTSVREHLENLKSVLHVPLMLLQNRSQLLQPKRHRHDPKKPQCVFIKCYSHSKGLPYLFVLVRELFLQSPDHGFLLLPTGFVNVVFIFFVTNLLILGEESQLYLEAPWENLTKGGIKSQKSYRWGFPLFAWVTLLNVCGTAKVILLSLLALIWQRKDILIRGGGQIRQVPTLAVWLCWYKEQRRGVDIDPDVLTCLLYHRVLKGTLLQPRLSY